ncbi:hypothetical protein L210DRAFT_3648678 [Boletus edulis BED1]|uniref:Uncharacterized protein n=1 Tax=Boletus edulis BED1 TaxID=1328754 RepID=A0AAD4BMK6_BOLED|nr:hypothetical protein L210DRAFT_3648678 [Boletus edulis BED1]
MSISKHPLHHAHNGYRRHIALMQTVDKVCLFVRQQRRHVRSAHVRRSPVWDSTFAVSLETTRPVLLRVPEDVPVNGVTVSRPLLGELGLDWIADEKRRLGTSGMSGAWAVERGRIEHGCQTVEMHCEIINLAQRRVKGRPSERGRLWVAVVKQCQVCGVAGGGVEAEDRARWEGVDGLSGVERAERGEELERVCGEEGMNWLLARVVLI